MSARVDPEVKQYLRRLKYRRKISGPPIDMRPRVQPVARLGTILHQHRDGKRRNLFISSRDADASKIRDVTKEPSPFWFPPDNQVDCYQELRKRCEERRRKEELKLPVFKKPSHRFRQTADLMKRLRIPVDDEPKTAESRPKTILDIDPEYFSIVEGRPIGVYDRRTTRDFIMDIRELLKTKLHIGYITDEILLIDEQFREEQLRLNRLSEELNSFVMVFDDFLAEDHAKSMQLLKKADKAAAHSRELQEEIKLAVRKMGVTKTQVFLNEDRWSLCKMYRNFLFKVSPMKWRLEHDFVHFGQQQLSKEEYEIEQARDLETHSDTDMRSFTQITSLEQIIAIFAKEEEEPDPILYFEEPSQLLQILKSLASQSLASLLHIEQVRVPLEALLAGVEKTKILVNQELKFIRGQIQQLENEIDWEEKRLGEIRAQFHDIVDKIYTEIMIGSPDMLTMLVWVEDLYERCIAPNDSHLTVIQMMTHLEQRLEHELVALDYLNKNEVTEARQIVYREEEKQIKEAQDAQRKIQEFDQLINRMHRAIEPSPDKPLRKLVWRSRPPQVKKKKSVAMQELSEEEADRITFFTDQAVLEPLTKFLTDQSLAQDTAQLFRRRIEAGRGMEVAYGKHASALGITGISDTAGVSKCLMRPIVEASPIDKTQQELPAGTEEPLKLKPQKSLRRSDAMKEADAGGGGEGGGGGGGGQAEDSAATATAPAPAPPAETAPEVAPEVAPAADAE